MARTKKTEQTLEEMIPIYGEINSQCNELTKRVNTLKADIKKAIKTAGKANKDIVIGGWKCSLAITDASDFNEARLIEFCKQNNIDVVRTKEYIDGAELERLMFNGSISKDIMLEMDKCKDKKEKETLRCVKARQEEE